MLLWSKSGHYLSDSGSCLIFYFSYHNFYVGVTIRFASGHKKPNVWISFWRHICTEIESVSDLKSLLWKLQSILGTSLNGYIFWSQWKWGLSAKVQVNFWCECELDSKFQFACDVNFDDVIGFDNSYYGNIKMEELNSILASSCHVTCENCLFFLINAKALKYPTSVLVNNLSTSV